MTCVATVSCFASAAPVATAQHFRMPDPVVRDAAMPIGTPDTLLPRPATSFGAATCDGWIYVLGGYTGPPHDYYMEDQQRDFYRVNLHDRSHIEWLPHDDRIQSCTLESHDGSLYRIGGMQALNTRDEDQALHSLDAVMKFDPRTGTWSAGTTLPEPRSSQVPSLSSSAGLQRATPITP